MVDNNVQLLNSVYREISENLGMDTALEIYRMFKGQQITFPVRFFSSQSITQLVAAEYDGSNIRELARKYKYSEKTIRRMLKTVKNKA